MSWGTPMIESWLAPKGELTFMWEGGREVIVVHPRDMLIQQGKGRLPFESRMNLGIRELERDRRRHRA